MAAPEEEAGGAKRQILPGKDLSANPGASDAYIAPAGKSAHYARAPVLNLGAASIDWSAERDRYRNIVIDRIRTLLVPDIEDRIELGFRCAPRDFGKDPGANLCSALSLEPILTRSAWFRAHNRDDHSGNLFEVGAAPIPAQASPGSWKVPRRPQD